jgi:hypothetical protein
VLFFCTYLIAVETARLDCHQFSVRLRRVAVENCPHKLGYSSAVCGFCFSLKEYQYDEKVCCDRSRYGGNLVFATRFGSVTVL